MTRRITRRSGMLFIAILLAAGAAADNAEERELLRLRLESLGAAAEPRIGEARIAAMRLISELYMQRGFGAAWTPSMARELMRAVRDVGGHGLLPEDFHLSELSSRLGEGGLLATDPASRLELDILLTDAFLRLGYTLHFGKLNPERLDPHWNFSRSLSAKDPVAVIGQALAAGTIADTLAAQTPGGFFYTRLQAALARYRTIQGNGGWPEVPAGPVLEPGERNPRVPVLRQRLAVTGDHEPGEPADPQLYDGQLEAALKGFQLRHGVEPDGVVGPDTLAELSVPVGRRIDQIRASLERVRWVFRDLDEDFIIVNIAGFNLHLVRERQVVWTTRVQVGKTYHETPVFRSQMKYLVLNPTWTPPPSILHKEILPKVRRDPGYLAARNMSVVDSAGRIVDPSTVDFSATGRFPHSIRQEPGPGNALGEVKFIFPNSYFVYLHDTPSKRLFDRAERAFSHGCIRTQSPLDLAELLLADQAGWDRAAIDRTIGTRRATTVMLSEPMTVMLLYWTAEVTDDGRLIFFHDPYGRDDRVIAGLDAPFQPTRGDLPEGAAELLRPGGS